MLNIILEVLVDTEGKKIKQMIHCEFPGASEVRTWCFHCRSPGTEILQVAQCSQLGEKKGYKLILYLKNMFIFEKI